MKAITIVVFNSHNPLLIISLPSTQYLMKVLAVIPSRFASTRFPGKPLVKIGDKTMAQRVYEQVKKATDIDTVIVATDDERIYNHVLDFGGEAMMTAEYHQNGTERCAEVIEKLHYGYDVVLNIQGDEPFIQPEQVTQLAHCFQNPSVHIATLAQPTENTELIFSANTAKVIFDDNFKALYFSRQPIPHLRGVERDDWGAKKAHHLHVGVYGYRKDVLKEIVKLSTSKLESLEMLEQLRWIENGYNIAVSLTQYHSISVDTPDDLAAAENFLHQFPPHN